MKIGPYELNSIHCGECSELMAALPDACIDLTVTSPPYDNLRIYNGYTFPFEQIAQQLYRVTKPGGVVVWVVDDKKENGAESGTSLRQAIYFIDLGFNLHDKMIYEAANGAMGATNEYLQCFEMMFVFSKGTPRSVNLIYDRKNIEIGNSSTPKTKSRSGGSLSDRHFIQRQEYGRRKNIWRYAVGGPQEVGYHPAIFPEALAHDHIISWSNPGDLVLDPMIGSGTVAKMAVVTGRQYLGFDISQEYCDLARRRAGEVEREQRKEWRQVVDNSRLDDLPMFQEFGS